MKKSKIIGVIVVILIIVLTLSMCGGAGNSGGDGKSTCRNCGRSKRLSAMGYCSTCQKGFNEWQDRYYDNNP